MKKVMENVNKVYLLGFEDIISNRYLIAFSIQNNVIDLTVFSSHFFITIFLTQI